MALLREEHRDGSQAGSLRSLMLAAREFYARNAAIDGTSGVRELSAHVMRVIDQLLLPLPVRAAGGVLPDSQASSPASRFRAILRQLHEAGGEETAGVGGGELAGFEWDWARGALAVGGGASDQAGGSEDRCASPLWWEESSLLALLDLTQLGNQQEPAYVADDGPLPLNFALFQFGGANLVPAHAPSAVTITDDVTAAADAASALATRTPRGLSPAFGGQSARWPAGSAVLDDWGGLFGLVGSETL